MKRTAVLLAALILLFSVWLTAHAAPDPTEGAVQNSGAGIADGLEGAVQDDAAYPQEETSAVLNRQQKYPGETTPATEPAAGMATEDAAATEAPTQPATAAETLPAAQAEDAPVNHTPMIIAIVCGASLLLFLLILLVVLLRRKRPSGAEDFMHGVSMHGTAVRIEVLAGACYNANLQFRLRRNLTVGTGSGCDLVFDDPQMAQMHAVIALNNGVVTIAECAAAGNTYVGGMKIFAPNRLRSGDIVTVGSTSFQIFFDE